MSTTTAQSPHLDSLQGRGDCVGECDAKYTSVWEISVFKWMQWDHLRT
jgi:hypothetical protein